MSIKIDDFSHYCNFRIKGTVVNRSCRIKIEWLFVMPPTTLVEGATCNFIAMAVKN